MILISVELFLFRGLKRIMKNSLNYHYTESWSSLKYLLSFNMIYFLLLFSIDVWVAWERVDYDSMFGFSTNDSYEDWKRVLLVWAQLIASTWLFLYALFNTKSVKFKDWIFDIMTGYKILDKCNVISIFIVKNKLLWNRNLKNESLTSEENDHSSILSNSGKIDYDESDDFMKNFKLNYN